jgi:hypothetical protein
VTLETVMTIFQLNIASPGHDVGCKRSASHSAAKPAVTGYDLKGSACDGVGDVATEARTAEVCHG